MEKNSPRQISAAIENLLKTGKLITQTGLDLQQVSSFIYFYFQLYIKCVDLTLKYEIECCLISIFFSFLPSINSSYN